MAATKENTKRTKNEESPLKWYESWTFLLVLCITVPILLRSFFYAPFHIPSGSMKSTLLIGDYIFVSKFAYGYSRYSFPLSLRLFEGRALNKKPKRGDVIVFRLPSNPKIDYIKRLVGMPGETIQVKKGILYINNKKVPRKRIDDFIQTNQKGSKILIKQYIETLPNGLSYHILDQHLNGRLDNTEKYKIPPGHYFFMGDNRDNSQDSRVLGEVGYVPEENLAGRADIIFLSAKSSVWKFWNWLNTFRENRFFKEID